MKAITPSGNYRYYLTFIDVFSKYTVVYILKNKSEVFEKWVEFSERMQTLFNKRVKVLRSDNGGEYISGQLSEYLKAHGTKQEFTCPYTPQQNGLAERKNRTLSEMAKCMILDAGMNNKFWAEAINTENYILNRLPNKSNNVTPYE